MPDTIQYEGKMHSYPYRWGINLLIILSIFFSAEIGRMVGIPSKTLQITVLWPPTGISLAALLIYGYRTWIGIFFGNLFYNWYHLFTGSETFLNPFFTGLTISLGSLAQALIAAFVIRRLASKGYFNNLQDIFIFLFSGILSCLIASTIGVFALYLSGNVSKDNMLILWLTFWLGDTLGIYVFTSFLVIWLIYKIPADVRWHLNEILFMLGVFFLITYLTLQKNLPLTYILFPWCIWVTYTFKMHGATLSLLLVCLTTIIPTAFGIGPVVEHIVRQPLLFLVSFLEIITSTTLIFAGLLNERYETWKKMEEYSRNLESKVQSKTKALKQIQSEVFVKEKLASLGLLIGGIGRQIKEPLHEIGNYVTACKDCLSILIVAFNSIKDRMEEGQANAMQINLESLKNCLFEITKFNEKAEKSVDLVLDQSAMSAIGKVEIKSINLHVFLNNCLQAAVSQFSKMFPHVHLEIIKEYDNAVNMLDAEAEDLTRAFMNILENTWFFLKDIPKPRLIVKTVSKKETIEITLRDNSKGISQENLLNFFQPSLLGEGGGMGLAIAHDIIVQEHHGEISVSSIEGQYLEIKIILPKSRI